MIPYAFEWEDYYNLNMKAIKSISVGQSKMSFHVNIENVLNMKHLSSTGFAGSGDSRDYYGSLKMWYEEGEAYGTDLVGTTDEDKSYINMPNMASMTYLNPRRITLGLTLNF